MSERGSGKTTKQLTEALQLAAVGKKIVYAYYGQFDYYYDLAHFLLSQKFVAGPVVLTHFRQARRLLVGNGEIRFASSENFDARQQGFDSSYEIMYDHACS